MTALRHHLRPGAYCDSIVLLEVQRSLAGLPGVLDAGAVMATEVNLSLLAARDLLPPSVAATAPDDLLVVVRGETDAAAEEALAQVGALLSRRRTPAAEGDFRPKSLAAAVKLLPEARWVLVSVPGRFAARVAREALDLGRHVFLFSDNVPLAEEVSLKEEAAHRGLLVLGPDCGTAILGGAGLGFANRVRRGRVGLVAASGTGLQAVACRLHALGEGVSHALGTGGRDLASEVAGRTALQALDLLARDPETAVVVFLSKPPAAEVTGRLLAAARETAKPVVVYFQGATAPEAPPGNVRFAGSLTAAAKLAAALAAPSGGPAAPAAGARPQGAVAEAEPAGAASPGLVAEPKPAGARSEGAAGGFLRGLFSGGTLAYEALLRLSRLGAPIHSNLKAPGVLALPDLAKSRGHTVLDLGDDAFTVGRLHPMMDLDLLRARLRQEADDAGVGALLFDVVLGDGAHPDPASELAPVLAAVTARRPDLEVVAIVVGTEEDPQGLARQVESLAAAGARVFGSVDEAVEHLAARLERPGRAEPGTEGGAAESGRSLGPGGAATRSALEVLPPAEAASPAARGSGQLAPPLPVPLDALAMPVAAINVGLETFHASLMAQGAPVLQVDWRPPAGGNERLLAVLDRMRRA
jgi:FdrA protein